MAAARIPWRIERAAMLFRLKKSGDRAYLQMVENNRVDGAARRSAVVNLGRADGPMSAAAKRIGGSPPFGRIWERLGIGAVLADAPGRAPMAARSCALQPSQYIASSRRCGGRAGDAFLRRRRRIVAWPFPA
jgi:hypothetical protein